MAAALVGQALLSETVKLILDQIASPEFRGFIKNRKLNLSLLEKLKTTLLSLDAVLIDAEEQQITNKKVKEWLEELKDAILDAEDLLDRINTDNLRRKVEAQSTNQVQQCYASINLNPWRVNSKIEALILRLEQFAKQKDTLGLKGSLGRRVSHRTPTSSVVNELGVVGRDLDKEKLMNLLLSDAANNNSIGVITILGMGGVGKTTLAQLLYNDSRVKKHFDLKAWAYVSENFDATMVTKTLLESAASKSYETKNLDLLRTELSQILNHKKFLFVLDDFWNDKYNDWDDLRAPFSLGKQGSRIIITTRQKEVARMTHTFPVHHLEPLSHEDCWSLLARNAFENGDPHQHLNLEVIGREIAKKCDGLPIAAKTLGGILRSKENENEWNKILRSNIWELPNNDVLPALRLSYLYLPSHLKRCFAYCSIFPKNYLLNRKLVILLWMADGLLQPYEKKSMEEIGDEYFDELLSRSLLQQVGNDFVMHHLVNDLATVVSGRSCSRFEGGDLSENVRQLSYSRGRYDSWNNIESFYRVNRLRTFLPLPLSEEDLQLKRYLTKRVTDNFLLRQRCLRVLSLAYYNNINKLPNSIGNLIHLRFLDLSFTPIERLPNAIFNLYNLQTLRLLNCEYLSELPAGIEKLINLRHLDMSGTKLKKMARQITRLTNLQTLTTWVVGEQSDGLRIKDLRYFPKLQGILHIFKLCNVIDLVDASEANLKDKELIEALLLNWGREFIQSSQTETDVLDQLQPSRNLRKLSIESYNGTRFPKWLGDFSFSNIVHLNISDCNFCLFLPPLGQLPSLKELAVVRMASVKTVGSEFYGSFSSSLQPFPSLEHLRFVEMLNWEEWLYVSGEEIQISFPNLKFLWLDNCPKLKGFLPRHSSGLINVKISNCDKLEASDLSWATSIEHLRITGGGPCSLSILENDSPSMLSTLRIERTDSLPSFPKMGLSSNCLRWLSLNEIPSLTSFPTEGLPTLQTLYIWECKNLELPPTESWCNYKSLENLTICDSCHSLTSFALGCFPVLEHLELWTCPNLKFLSISEDDSSQILSNLRSVKIWYCPNLESFPQGGLSAPNLIEIVVYKCGSLSSTAIAKCGFQLLLSLSKCTFGGDDIVKVLLEERLLPTSLLSLYICDLADLEFLEGEGLYHLASLEELHVENCPRLESLPEDRLPSSLKLLKIEGCLPLKARYVSGKRRRWSKISHIPTIIIDDKVII